MPEIETMTNTSLIAWVDQQPDQPLIVLELTERLREALHEALLLTAAVRAVAQNDPRGAG